MPRAAGRRRGRARCSSCPTSSRSTPTSRAGSSPGSSAASCARPASSGASSALSGGIDSALVAYLVAEAIGADKLLCVLMPYRTSSPASRARRRGGRRRRSAARASSSRSRRWSTGTSGSDGDARGRAARRRSMPRAVRRGNFMARMRMSVIYDRSVDVRRARRRDGQQDGVADRLHDALRRQRVRVQPDRRPVQEPGPPAGRGDGRAAPDHRQGPERRPLAGPDRRGRGLVQLPAARPDPVLADRPAARARTSSSRWASTGRSSSAWSGSSRRPSSSARSRRSRSSGPRTAGVDYLYPRRRPGSART